MSLLTLIILGEGAIATAKACQYVVYAGSTFSFKGSVAVVISCAVLNLYLLYMIYFDWIHEERFGTIRQQIWSILHFPLHTALVLAVEGASQCITWMAATNRKEQLIDEVIKSRSQLVQAANPTDATWHAAARELNATADSLLVKKLQRASDFASTVAGLGYYTQLNVSCIPTIQNGTNDP